MLFRTEWKAILGKNSSTLGLLCLPIFFFLLLLLLGLIFIIIINILLLLLLMFLPLLLLLLFGALWVAFFFCSLSLSTSKAYYDCRYHLYHYRSVHDDYHLCRLEKWEKKRLWALTLSVSVSPSLSQNVCIKLLFVITINSLIGSVFLLVPF